MTALEFRHVTPAVRTFAGAKALEALPRELKRVGSERAAVFCGASMSGAHAGQLARVEDVIGERLVGRFDGVRAGSPLDAVVQGADFLAAHDADAVVVVGGGSAVVTGRAATILLAEGKDARELCTYRSEDGSMVSPRLDAAKLPQLVVPTSPTTAYAKAGSAVQDVESGDRLALFDPKVRAGSIFFDRDLALSAPRSMVRASALNVLCMAVDGLQSSKDPLADASLLHALRLVARMLPAIDGPQAGEARLKLMAAALLAGEGSDHVGTGLAQALSHALGPRSDVGNGVVEAMLVPHTLRHNEPVTGMFLDPVASTLEAALGGGADRSSATTTERVAVAVKTILRAAGVPDSLREIGLSDTDLDAAVAHTQEDWAVTRVPRPADQAQMRALLQAAW